MILNRRFLSICLLSSAAYLAGCSSEVKVGAVVSRSGGTSGYGQMVAKGIDLALEELNNDGGVLGAPLTVVYRDDASRPDTGVEVVNDLINNEGIELIIGAVSSSVTMGIAEVCQDKGVVLLSPSASAPKLSTVGDYIFRNYPSDIIEGTAMADFAKDLVVRRVVVFALDDEFGRGLTEVFRRQFESKSRKVLKVFHLPDGVTPEALAPMIEETMELKPAGIYVIAYVNEMATLLQALDAAGNEAMVMGSGAVTEELAQLAGPSAENLVYAQPKLDVDSTDPAVASFVSAFTEKYGHLPDVFAAHAYDALKSIALAVEQGKMAHPDSVKLQLLNLDFVGAAGHTAFDERGDVTRYPQLFVLHQGRPIPYDQFVQEGGKIPIPGK